MGLVHYIFHSQNWRIEGVCEFQDLCVAPDVPGVDRALIMAVYAASDARDISNVY